MFSKNRLILGFALVVLGLFGALIWSARPDIHGSADFPLVERHQIYNVDDAGIGDLNGDGRLDRWTTNHSGAQWIEIAGADPNGAIAAGLAQDSGLPGFAQGDLAIPRVAPARIYMDHTRFVVDIAAAAHPLRGSFIIPWQVRTTTQGAAEIRIEPCTTGPDTGPDCHRVFFTVEDGGRITVEPVPPPSDGFPIEIDLEESFPLAQIQVGSLALEPPSHHFTYASKDRHGMALTDLDADGVPDLFISRGGARGRLAQAHPGALDELFEWSDQGFREAIEDSGIVKDACAGRQTAWIDINGDGLSDLYQVCGRAHPPHGLQPNRLYLQTGNKKFTEAGREFGLDLPGAGSFRFFRNPAPDAPLSMLWATSESLSLHVASDREFTQRWSLPRRGGKFDKIIMMDVQGDGHWAAMVFSPQGNLIVHLAGEAPVILDAAGLGLPSASADGVYLDINADGTRDIFTVPQGLFLGTGGGFGHSDALDVTWAGMGGGARFAWFDTDGDHDLDLWLLKRGGDRAPKAVRWIYNRGPNAVRRILEGIFGRAALRPRYWLSLLYENRIAKPGNHQFIEIEDTSGRAVTAGVPVFVTTIADGQERSRLYLTGEADTARLSQTLNQIFIALPGDTTLGSIRSFGAGALE